jgi:hypothetical protein
MSNAEWRSDNVEGRVAIEKCRSVLPIEIEDCRLRLRIADWCCRLVLPVGGAGWNNRQFIHHSHNLIRQSSIRPICIRHSAIFIDSGDPTMKAILIAGALLATCTPPLYGQQPPGTPATSIAQRTAGLERHDGFVPFYVDLPRNRVLIEVPRPGEDVLYFVQVAKGVGNVDLGIDRGAGGASKVIYFERQGNRAAIVERNLRFRAPAGNAALQEGMEQSFASSVLASLPIEADENGRLLLDASGFILRDAIDLEGTLRRRNQGAYRLDPARSAIYAPRTKGNPDNTEFETTLTYASDNPGPLVNRVAPEGRALTIRVHQSFLRPPTGYTPRIADPRIGMITLGFRDYSAPYNEGTDVQWIRRFRLEKKDPSAATSEPKAPLVFYLDPGVPEPIRSPCATGFSGGTRHSKQRDSATRSR